jgi:hypothetical protein
VTGASGTVELRIGSEHLSDAERLAGAVATGESSRLTRSQRARVLSGECVDNRKPPNRSDVLRGFVLLIGSASGR